MQSVFIAAVVVLFAFNLTVTVQVFRADFLAAKQKIAQGLVIWLVPIFGAIAISMFLKSNRETAPADSRHAPDKNDYPAANLPPYGPSDP
jgi:NADH:ubiquinone oxidoreductase subunit 6 (subunit J)